MINKKIRETFFTTIVSSLVGIMVTNSAYANSQYPNTATMTYKKIDNTKVKVSSNTVITIKEETPGIDLVPLLTPVVSIPCGTWVFPVYVTNTGTYNTDYALSLEGLPSQMAYTIYEDPNQNGKVDLTENPITNTTLLHPGKKYYFNIKVKDNGCKPYNSIFPVDVHAVSNMDPTIKSFKPLVIKIGPTGTVLDNSQIKPTPTPIASITPTPSPTPSAVGLKASLKKSVFPVGGVIPGDTLSYFVEFTNENQFNANDTIITDKLPDQVDLLKDAGAEPVASANGTIEYSQEGTTWASTVGVNPRYIRFKYPLVTSLQTVTALFKVKVRDDVQAGSIDNIARSQYINPNNPNTSVFNYVNSNMVSNTIKNIYSIIGTVYDQITGLPVEGVTVDVYDKNGNKVGTDLTGKLGKYNVPVPTKGEYKVVYTGSNGEIINQKRSLVEKIGANPSPIELAGKVSDSQTKEVYPDTKLQLIDSNGNIIFDTVTDKNGKFIIDADKNGNDLKPGTYMIKIIGKDGKIIYGRVTVSVVAGDVILNLEILIDPFGIVYDKLGGKDVRIKDSKVILYSGYCSQKSSIVKLDDLEKGVSQTNPYFTDVNGTYQYFLNKDQLTNKTYCLNVTKEGYKEENYALVTNPSKTEVGRYTLTIVDSKGNKKFLSNIASIPHEVPLEPLSVFDIVKTANKSTIEIGDIVTYKIEATNKLKFKVRDAFIEDNIPHGFRYVDGTMLVNNQKLANFKPSAPEKLRVPVGDLAPDQKVTIAYQLRTGIKVNEGPAINIADIMGKAPNGTDIISDQVKATVFVKKGIFSKNGAVLGRVYVDSDDNGVYNGKDNGVENVNIYTANGLRITTDLKGKYSVPDLPNGDFLLSVDKTTLPKDLYLPEDAVKVAKERKAQLEKATTSEIDINKGNTFNVIEGKDLVLTNSSGMKAVLTIKDGKELVVRNSSTVCASSDIVITQEAEKSGKLFKQADLSLQKGLNTIPVKFIDTDGKQVKTKQLDINVIPDVKVPNDEIWIGDEGNSKRVFITESGFSKANFRLVKLDPFELNIKTSSPENITHSLKAVYVYPEQFSVKEIPYITYPDIQNHWSREIVEYESGLEIIHGYPDGNFKPSRSISRAEATKLTLVALKSFDVKIGTSLGYIIDTDSTVTAKILDKDGNVVKEFFADASRKAGINLIYWDGKNSKGKISNVGKYTFEVISSGKNGNTNKLATPFEVIPAIPNYHPNGKANFPDVPDWFWATAFIKVANEENLVKGYDNGNFLPDKFIPRYEMATIAVKALGLDLSLGKEILKFKDSEEVPVWARKAVYLADMYGILPAYPNGKYYPYRNTSRAEIANVVLELINRQKLDVKVGGTIVEDLSSVNVEGKKVELSKEKQFSIPLKKEYKDDVDVTVPEIENFKVMIDKLYKSNGLKRDLFDSFVK